MLDVLVIGAGAAGLVAARALRRAGVSVLVLEAREAAGGRIRTVRDAFGPFLEAGAEFVHGAPHPLLRRIRVERIRGAPWAARSGEVRRADELEESAFSLVER